MVTKAPPTAAAVLLSVSSLSLLARISLAAQLEPQARAPGGIVAIVNQDVITMGSSTAG